MKEIFGNIEFDTFYDIGVGIDRKRSPREAWQIDWNCKIVGFEPSLKRYADLIGKFPGTLLPLVLRDQSGYVKGYEGGDFSDFRMFISDDEKDRYTEVLRVSSTLDEIDEVYGEGRRFIWADIEGSELLMLKGARKLLRYGLVFGIRLELNPKPLALGWCSDEEVINFLEEYGYKIIKKINKKPHYDAVFCRE